MKQGQSELKTILNSQGSVVRGFEAKKGKVFDGNGVSALQDKKRF